MNNNSNDLYPEALTDLILSLAKLSGVGNRTAERYALELYTWDETTYVFQFGLI